MAYIEGCYKKSRLNTTEINQNELNITNKYRSNPLRWNGQFSPQLVEVLLKKYSRKDSVVLDPFTGSGTTLIEAGIMGLEAIGLEINPAAKILAQTYEMINIPYEQRKTIINEITSLLGSKFNFQSPLFAQCYEELSDIEIKERLLDCFYILQDSQLKKVFETLIILIDFYRPDLTTNKVYKEWAKYSELLLGLPFSDNKITVVQADARKTNLKDSSIDLVITSPPYINVFNYHQQYRASVESLYNGLLLVAHSEIGSNRKHRGNRFLTVIQYCLDMALTFIELSRICCENSRIIFVVGKESSVRGIPFYNGEIVSEVAFKTANMNLVLRQQRVFKNKFGDNIYEDILHFSPNSNVHSENKVIGMAREIAEKVLQASFKEASIEVSADIVDAIKNINSVKPSPFFDKKNITLKHRRESITA